MVRTVVIIPAYNEEKTIGKVIDDIPKSFVDDILIVDDGSTDQTVKISESKGANVISHSTNQGVGKAFFTGIQEALKLNPDIIVNMDADGQFDSQDIPVLIQLILEGKADMVTCTRHPYEGLPVMKKFGNKLFTWMTSRITKQKFTDTQCGFRAYSFKAAQALNLFGEYTYTQEAFLDLATKGFKIIEIPLYVKPQREGKSKVVKNIFSYGLRALLIIMRTLRDHQPLRFFGIPGIMIFMAGMIPLLSLVFLHIFNELDIATHQGLLLISSVLCILGFITITLSLIADMFDRVNKNQERTLLLIKQTKEGRKCKK